MRKKKIYRDGLSLQKKTRAFSPRYCCLLDRKDASKAPPLKKITTAEMFYQLDHRVERYDDKFKQAIQINRPFSTWK